MRVVRGDLIALAKSGEFDVVIHGCNCFCTMGKGIAATIKREFPEAFEADRGTPSGDASKLGTISFAVVRCLDRSLVIVNAYTQFDWRGRGVKVDYDAVGSAMRRVRQEFPDARIGYPRIGAGLAGGDWERIAQIIDAELQGADHTLVEFEPTATFP